VGYAYHKILCNNDSLPIDYEFVDINPSFEIITGLKSADILGRRVTDVLPGIRDGEFDWVASFGNIAINGGSKEFEQYSEPLGKWYKVYVTSPAKYFFVTYFTDITSQKKMLEEQMTLNTFFNDVIIELNEEMRYVNYRSNAKFSAMQKKKVIGKSVLEIYGEAFATQLENACKRAKESGQIEHWIHKSPLPGLDRWFLARIIYRTDCFNNKKYTVVSSDITEKIEAERAIFEEKERLQVTLKSIGDAVITTDKRGKIVSLNPIAEQLTGWSEKDALGKIAKEVFRIISEETRVECEDPFQKVLTTGKIIGLANHTALIARDGTEIPIADSAAPIKDVTGKVHGVVLVFRDVSGEKSKQAEIEYLSYHDSLTGLYNRRFFEEELSRLDVRRNLPISLIIGDVNGLKLINDAFGHLAGDKLLQKAAEAMKQVCRADDIIARWGGDEFVIILPKTNQSSAAEIIQRIKNACSETAIESIKLSISLGSETKESPDKDIMSVLTSAETSMYKNKLHESQSMVGSAIKVIHGTLLEKNQREAEHSRRVADISKRIAAAMELSEAFVCEMETIGLMHDIGKIAIAESILEKPGDLTEEEWHEMNRHPEVGYRILSTSNDTAEIALHVLAHHEWFDGKGYPAGIKGEEISLQARILAVADAFDAMTSERPYRSAYSKTHAIKTLQKSAGSQFDPQVVKVFIEKVLGT
jgi:diguanylate cyclase (GGDEF)-like protein/PAS domain S-box-containing protein